MDPPRRIPEEEFAEGGRARAQRGEGRDGELGIRVCAVLMVDAAVMACGVCSELARCSQGCPQPVSRYLR